MNENYIVYICFYLFFLLFALIDASTVKLNIRERKFFLTVLVGVLGMFAGCRYLADRLRVSALYDHRDRVAGNAVRRRRVGVIFDARYSRDAGQIE